MADDVKPEEGHNEKKQFSESDRAKLDEVIAEREHRKWAGEKLKSFGRVAQWIAAVGMGGTLLYDWLSKLIKGIAGP